MPRRFAVVNPESAQHLPLFPQTLLGQAEPEAASQFFTVPASPEIAGEPELARKPPARAALRHPSLTPNQAQRIAIEGPPRVGKSTLARLLAERMDAARIAEPDNNPFLPRFYAGEPGMAFAAQMWFLRERMAQQSEAARLHGPVVSDYILEKDKLFAHLNLSDRELSIYRQFHDSHPVRAPRPDLVVYLQANPAVLAERRRRKGVTEEQDLDAGYFDQVCQAYEHFFSRYSASRLLVVDTSAIDFVHSGRERELLLDRILAPVHGREHFAPLAQIA